MRQLPSADAERAVALLRRTLADHRDSARDVKTRSSRMGLRDGRSELRRQASLLRLLSIAEAFLMNRLVEVAEPLADPSGTILRMQIWTRAEEKATGTWDAMAQHYKSWLGVSLANQQCFKDLKSCTEARNAVAHGIGTLTRRQQRQAPKVTAALLSQNFTVVGHAVTVPEAALATTLRVCAETILWVDGQTIGTPPPPP